MEAKLCLILILIILGTLTVQGANPRKERKSAWEVFARQPECFANGGYCTAVLPCFAIGVHYCPQYFCWDPRSPYCCCNHWKGMNLGNISKCQWSLYDFNHVSKLPKRKYDAKTSLDIQQNCSDPPSPYPLSFALTLHSELCEVVRIQKWYEVSLTTSSFLLWHKKTQVNFWT